MPLNFAMHYGITLRKLGGERSGRQKKDSDSTEEKSQPFSQSFPFEQFFPIRNFSDKYVSDFLQQSTHFSELKTVSKNFFLLPMVFFLTGRLNAGQILFHRCHKFSPSTNPTRRNSKLQKRRLGEPLPRDRTSLTILLNIG